MTRHALSASGPEHRSYMLFHPQYEMDQINTIEPSHRPPQGFRQGGLRSHTRPTFNRRTPPLRVCANIRPHSFDRSRSIPLLHARPLRLQLGPGGLYVLPSQVGIQHNARGRRHTERQSVSMIRLGVSACSQRPFCAGLAGVQHRLYDPAQFRQADGVRAGQEAHD